MDQSKEVVSSARTWPKWSERINSKHRLTPLIRKFCFSYVSASKKMTNNQFAEKFGVGRSTIVQWLEWPEVQKEIERLLSNNEERIMALIESKQEQVIEGLLEIFNDEKTPAEVRRKVGYNLLSFGKLRDVNTGRTIVNQQQAVLRPYEHMSDGELDAAIKEIDELANG